MPTIYPLLKPYDWPHAKLVAHRRLIDSEPSAPVVAYGFDAGDNYQFVPATKVDDLDLLDAEALGNLAALDYPWELGDKGGLRFAASSGREFSAERLLDIQAMTACQDLLESEHIVVAAPRRTCLFATRHGQSAKQMNLFLKLVSHTFNDDSYGHAPISPLLFVVQGGKLQGIYNPSEAASASDHSERKPWWKLW